MKKYKAHLFDCDGTLVDSEIIAMGVAIDLLADVVEDVKRGVKIDRLALVQEFAGWHFDKMIGAVGERYSVKMDTDALQSKKIPQTIEALKQVQVIPGMPGYLESLTGQEIAVVTTSEFSRVNPCLVTANISHYFPTEKKFSGADSLSPPAFKPAPDIYLHALKMLGVSAQDSVAYEDSVSGVKSARAAGIDVIGIVAASHIPANGKTAAAQKLINNGAAIVVSHASDLAAATAWMEGKTDVTFNHKVYKPEDFINSAAPFLSPPSLK